MDIESSVLNTAESASPGNAPRRGRPPKNKTVKQDSAPVRSVFARQTYQEIHKAALAKSGG